uniref:Got1-like family protein n=2 Tax=Populus TaxID=3689 RepID=A0A4U5QEB8_POPAL|nr:Got1-like family protein [Populus alba]
MVSFELNDRKKIGLGLTGFGIFFSFLGIVFFFDKGFLAMGNILFISGVSLTIGPKSTMQFFMKRQNFKGTISFGAGFFFVVIGWPVIGMILESYGFIVLFSGFWPTLAVFIQKIPILGWVFQQPFVRSFFDRNRGKRVPVSCHGNPSGYLTIDTSGTSLDDGASTIFASSSTSVASNIERKALSSHLMEEPFLGFLEFFAGDGGL